MIKLAVLILLLLQRGQFCDSDGALLVESLLFQNLCVDYMRTCSVKFTLYAYGQRRQGSKGQMVHIYN